MTCPVCTSNASSIGAVPGWGEWRRCQSCELEFVNPLALDEPPEQLYGSAYLGERQESAMQEFNDRLAQRDAFMADPRLWFWTPAFDETIAWLKDRVSPGATVLEIGSGLGFVLKALRNEGFDPNGLDVAAAAVDVNRRDGFRVWHGTVETVPSDWVNPEAIVSFFMLHHVDDPLRFLRTIRRQWPSAPVAFAQYGPTNRDPVRSSPPRTLTRWNSKALQIGLERAGYRATAVSIDSTGVEHSVFRPLRRAMRSTISFAKIHRLERRVERHVLPKFLRPLSQPDYVVLAYGEPA